MFDRLRLWASRVFGIFARRRLDEDLREELESHLDLLTEENLRRGMTSEEARRAARLRLGGVTQLRETHRELWGLPLIESLCQDVRYALRMLRKDPGFTAAAVFALAIGIAANTAVFTAFNATALRPLQATDPGRVMAIYCSTIGDENGGSFAYPDYLYYRDQNKVFVDLFAASGTDVSLSDISNGGERPQTAGGITAALGFRFFDQMAGTAELERAAVVSENYFAALGTGPVVGRSFSPSEPYPVAMLSGNFWERRFGSNPDRSDRQDAQAEWQAVYGYWNYPKRLHRHLSERSGRVAADLGVCMARARARSGSQRQ